MNSKKRLAVFASGAGSNAERLAEFFHLDADIEIACLVCNHEQAGVVSRYQNRNIPVCLITNTEANDAEYLLKLMKSQRVDAISLAGYLRLIPAAFIENFSGAIINIHPSLLPKFGGKGMYGRHVFEAVRAAGEVETGITIHLVNAEFDKGEQLAQFRVSLEPEDTVDVIAKKTQELEHTYFASTIKNYLVA